MIITPEDNSTEDNSTEQLPIDFNQPKRSLCTKILIIILIAIKVISFVVMIGVTVYLLKKYGSSNSLKTYKNLRL